MDEWVARMQRNEERSIGSSSSSKCPTPPPAIPSTAPTSPVVLSDQESTPRVKRSRSFGDAYLLSRRGQFLQSPGHSSLDWNPQTVIDEDGREDLDWEDDQDNAKDGVANNTGVTAPPHRHMHSKRNSAGSEKTTSKGDSYNRRASAIAQYPPSSSNSNSPRDKVQKLKSQRSVDFELGGDKVPSVPADGNQGKTSGSSGDKGKRKVTSSEMKLRRSNSERFSPEPNGQLKSALTPRRSTITAASTTASTSRKSMPSLAALDQQAQQNEIEQLPDALEVQGQRDMRKSGGSATSGSVSNGGDSVILPTDNSSPKFSPDLKKIPDPNELPPHVSKSKNAKFHKLFKSVPAEEYPIDSYSCAFKGDILLQGMMYVSQNWICFYSKIRARGRLLEIPFEKIISITREKLALIIPNAIGIQIADQKYVFGSFMSRDNTYKLLVTLWKHSQDSTDSANTKENDLSCYDDDFATKQTRRSLHNSIQGDDDITHSADISGESDTTEDDSEVRENPAQQENSPSTSGVGRSAEADTRVETPPDKVPGFFSIRCLDCRRILTALPAFAVRLQKVPRTNLLLGICSILVVFLLLSAMGLTYKIVLLQTRLEMSHLWTPGRQQSFRDQVMGNMYTLQSETHMATIHQLHDVLKANIQLLEQVHQSLKSLQGYPPWSCSTSQDCPPPAK